MQPRSFIPGFAVGVLLTPIASVAAIAATVTILPLARDGVPSPDGNGLFSTFGSYGEPVLNNRGEAAFFGRFTGTLGGTADDDYLVRAGSDGARAVIARQGQALPDVTGSFGGLFAVPTPRNYAMNDSGRVVFVAPRLGTPGGTADNSAVYSVRDPGLFWVHARRGDLAPSTTTPFNQFFPPTINDQPPAAVSFFASLGGATAPGALYTSRLGVLSPISWGTQPAPDASDADGLNGMVSTYPFAGTGEPAALRRNATEVALHAHLAGTSNAPFDDDGIFRASPDEFIDLARGNQSAPGGGSYQEFATSPLYNADGVAAFVANLKPVPSAGSIIALDWPGGGDVVAYSGQPAADGNGIFASLFTPSLNTKEAVAFRVTLAGTAGGALDDEAIYKGDSSLLVIPPLEDQIAREGQPVPEGGGVFAAFGNFPAINEANQVVFTATLRGTPLGTADDRGLYLWDPAQGLVKLLREGDVIDGRTVAAFAALTAPDWGGRKGLNDRGEVVARVDFSGIGGDGIYVFRLESVVAVPPAPSTPVRVSLRVLPNPVASGPLEVRWAAPAGSPARVTVFDAAGRMIRVLHDGDALAGGVRWDLSGAHGAPVPPGIYIVMIEAAGERRARRVAVIG